jgi:hypothetical protein
MNRKVDIIHNITAKYDINLMGKESLKIVKQHSPNINASAKSNKLNTLDFA